MIKLIIGEKGTGKTKQMRDSILNALSESNGNVACIEKGSVSTLVVPHQVRLVNSDEYNITSYNELYGMICGMLSSNHDITHLYIDGIFRMCGRNMSELFAFLKKVNKLCGDIDIFITLSCDKKSFLIEHSNTLGDLSLAVLENAGF